MMTRTADIKVGMKFDNYGTVLEVIEVRKVDGGVIVQWNGSFGNEFIENGYGITLKRIA